MRYAIVSALYAPHMGGVERYTQSLAEAFASAGHEVRVVTSALEAGAPERAAGQGVEVLRLPARPLLGGRWPVPRRNVRFRCAWEALWAWGPDRVVVNTRFYGLSVAAVQRAARESVPALVIEHGSAPLTLDNPVADLAVRAVERAMTARVRAAHPRFAGVSRRACEWLGAMGIETRSVVPNAIDAAAYRALASGEPWHPRLGLGPEAPLAVFAGRLTEAKGALMVAEAARMLPEVTFAMAGDGPLRQRVAREAQGRGNLRLLGSLDQGELSQLLREASCLVLPSRSEGFATVALEAGAWGTPIVATDVGGVAEVLDGTGGGVIMDGWSTEALAASLTRLLAWPAPEVRAARARLATHVGDACRWDGTLAALDRAFAG